MDKANAASVLMDFPPQSLLHSNNDEYDKAVTAHIKKVEKCLHDHSLVISDSGLELLELLDPSVHSISCMMVVNVLINTGSNSKSNEERLLSRLVELLCTFDSRQVRYIGGQLTSLLDRVSSGHLLPHSTAVNVFVRAVLRVDPSGTMLTSHHLNLVDLAFTTGCVQPVFDVIDKQIVYYPGMSNQRDSKLFLCDMRLPPTLYITKETALTNPIKAEQVLHYDYHCGMIYLSVARWPEALAAFERVITHPTRDAGVSTFMSQAHKKWVLVSLMVNGLPPALPITTSAAARKNYEVVNKPYLEVASYFSGSRDAQGLKREAEAGLKLWRDDTNLTLMREVLAAHQKWQIISLRNVYSKIAISDIRQKTLSAETGAHLDTDGDVELLISGMIQSGMLKGTIEKPDGKPSYLTFLSADEELTEQEFTREILVTVAKIQSLEPIFKATNERLGTNKDYVKHMLREQRREKERDGNARNISLGGFDNMVEDEDLLSGGMSSY